MWKRIVAGLLVGLLAATAADAQYGGGGGMGGAGGMGRGGGGHRGAGAAKPDPDQAPAPAPNATPVPRETPLGKIEIVGVVRAIDIPSGRITVAYEPVDALNWPAGTLPFQVAKTSLLRAASVGQKIRFRIESQQISDIEPYTPRKGDPAP